jgi:phospholipid transport system transporter-binding protein
MSFALPHQVTQANAGEITKQGSLTLAQTGRVDCSALADFDSSVLAVLLAWRRKLQERNQSLVVLNSPEKLRVLASVYGVTDLLGLQ